MTNSLSPFRWAEYPRDSIFVADGKFSKNAHNGKTLSQVRTEQVEIYAKKHGKSMGSIRGMSAKGDLHIEESEHRRGRK